MKIKYIINKTNYNIKAMKIFMIKYKHNKNFKQYNIVKFITITYSGQCYLVEDIETKQRGWIMEYDLFEINSNNYNNIMYEYDKNIYQQYIPEDLYLYKNTIVKLLSNENNNYKVKYLEDYTEKNIDPEFLIQIKNLK